MDLTHVHFEGRRVSRPSPIPLRAPRPRASAAPVAGSPHVQGPRPHGLPAFVLARAGLDPASYRGGPLERRRGACLRTLRVESEPAARARLEADPQLIATALSALLIGVSDFFRDAGVFDTIRTVVLPALREREGAVRVWSVGCSGGAELYSVAMALEESGLLARSHLLGTDCRTDAVADAARGIFRHDALAGMDAGLRSRYFERAPSGWQIADAIRRRTEWQVADATRGLAEGPWDLVLCRNVVIYLQPQRSDVMFREIVDRLSPGGFLVVGKAERPPAGLKLAAVGRCVHRKVRDAK